MLRTIHLHGALKRRFKCASVKLDCDSVAEAVRGLTVQMPGFAEYIRDRNYHITVANDQDEIAIDNEALLLGLGRRRHIHITPAAQAAGIETILIAGLVLTAAVSIASLFLLRPKVPDPNARERKDQSFLFNGPVNSTEQGHPVPIIYGGPIRVGSIVVSAGISTTDIAKSAIQAGSGGSYVGSTPGVLGGEGGSGGRAWQVDAQIQANKGGKSGGGGSRVAEESPNTLRSQATVKIVDLVGEGEMGGLVDGLKSVYLDDTPVQNPDGSYNFSGYSLEERLGLPDQDPMPGFTQQETGEAVGVDVTKLNPIVRTIADPVVDVARVTLSVNSLFEQDTKNGDLKPSSVQIAIDHQSNGGGYTQVVVDTIQGKTNSPYQRSYDIRLEGEAPHNIRVRRITPDSELASVKNETRWDSIFEIVEAKLTYPDSALYGITVDAKQFGSSIPGRSYEVYGLVIDIPSNYDPVARTYTGVWDGTFKRAVCNNPAWVLYDIIRNNRYGLGARIPVSSIDKFGLYAVAQYCDGLVPDGKGGQQPRYTINACIDTMESAYNVLASIASAFRGFVYWGSGSVVVAQDRPEDPTMLVSPANVVDGKLSYQSVIEKQRLRSVAIVYWNDPEDNYRLTPEIVEDDELIRRFGWKPGDSVVRFGCTNRAEAHFAARWMLDDQRNANKAVRYDAADDHNFVVPGSVVSVADPKFTVGRRGGRVRVAAASQVQLDSPVEIGAGQAYTLRVVLPDGTVSQRPVTTGASTTDTLDLGGVAWAEPPQAGAVWALESDTVANRQFRVRSATADEPPHSIYAVVYDPNSHDRVELDLDLQPANFLDLPTGPLPVPGNIAATEFLLQDGTAAVPAVQFSWESANDPRILFYQARYKRPTGDWEALEDGSALARIIRNTEPGTWSFMVRAVDGLGRKTAWATGDVELDGQLDALPNVIGLTIATDDEALQTVLVWTMPEDTRPLRAEVLFSFDANLANAVSLGLKDTAEHVVSQSGYYWVRTRFLNVGSGNPPGVNVTIDDLPKPAWDSITDRPETLTDLDPTAQQQITDLIATYGDTASAAASAAAAAAARDAAQSAYTLTAQALADAQDAVDLATGARDAADQAKLAAQTAASNAVAEALLAAGSADAAAGHVTTASDHADAAAGSASAASGHATAAQTAAGNSSVSAGNAATSETNAAGHASQAASSASVAAEAFSGAQLALARTFPVSISTAALSLGSIGTPASLEPLPASWQSSGYIETPASPVPDYVAFIGTVPNEPGAIYNLRAVTQTVQTVGAWPTHGWFARYLGPEYQYISESGVIGSLVVEGTGQIQTTELKVSFGATGQPGVVTLNPSAGCAHIRFMLLINRENSNFGQVKPSPTRTRIHEMTLRDVRADIAASAASLSAASAAAAETAAGQYAAASNLSQNNAATSAGAANTSAGNAAVSETNAAGSASSAASAANLSAQARDAAQAAEQASAASAAASSSSASTAAASATTAGQQASAANTSRIAADTAAGNASVSAGAAATSANTASTAANSASASSVVAANYFQQSAATLRADFVRGFAGWARTLDDVLTLTNLGVLPPGGQIQPAWEGGAYYTAYQGTSSNIFFARRFAVDPTRKYRLRSLIGAYKNGTDPGISRIYVGIIGLNGAGAVVDHGGYGSYRYALSAGTVTHELGDGQQRQIETIYTGSGNDSWTKFPPGTSQVLMVALMNETVRTLNSYIREIDFIDVTESEAANASAIVAQAAAASASASESSAANSVTTAAGHASTAQTAAGTATTQASLANASASAAQTAQTVTATYRDEAALRLGEMFPEALTRHAILSYLDTGSPAAAKANSYIPAANDYGSYLLITQGQGGGSVDMSSLGFVGLIPYEEGKIYELYNRLRTISTAGAWQVQYWYARFLDENFGYVSDRGIGNILAGTGADQEHRVRVAISPTPVTGTDAYISRGAETSVRWIRFGLLVNRTEQLGVKTAATLRLYQMNLRDVTGQVNAAASASASAASAASASASSASATSAAVLAANIGGQLINPNPHFLNWNNGYPDWWSNWSVGDQKAQITGDAVTPSLEMYSVSGIQDVGLTQHGTTPGLVRAAQGKYVLELDAQAWSGAGWLGTGLGAWCQDDSGNTLTIRYIDCANDLPNSGSPAEWNYRYIHKWRKLIDVPPGVTRITLYLFHSYPGLLGNPGAGKTIRYSRAGIRAATPEEIAANTVLPAVQAAVSVNAAAIATIDGRTQAYWAVSANAGGTSAAIEARAVSNPDGSTSSKVGVVAEEFSVTNTVAGVRKRALRVVGQDAIFDGSVTAQTGVFLGTGVKWSYQLKPRDFPVSDGTVVSFGVTFDSVPQVDFSTIGLAPLASGETYNLYPEGLSTSGFTARLKIITPGTTSNVSLTNHTAPGTGPTRQVSRGANGESSNGNYNLSVGGTYTGYAYYYDGQNQL